ncbi:hypothetical protein D3C72_1830420 [compost metagenome]
MSFCVTCCTTASVWRRVEPGGSSIWKAARPSSPGDMNSNDILATTDRLTEPTRKTAPSTKTFQRLPRHQCRALR